MQVAKRDCNEQPTRDFNIWLCGRQADLNVLRYSVGKPKFFLANR